MTTTTSANLATRRAELAQQLADLRASWPSLALAAARGDQAAAAELARTEAEAAELARDLERLELARQEADRERLALQQQAAVDERRRAERAYQDALAGRQTIYARYERAVDELVECIASATATGTELDRLAAAAGRPPLSLATRADVVDRLLTRLWVPLDRMLPAGGRVLEALSATEGVKP